MESGTERVRRWRKLHPDRVKKWARLNYWKAKEKRIELKKAVLTYYGKGKLACVVCGENRLACLSIDHIDGSGAKQRRSILKTGKGNGFYYWIKKNNYPDGFQTLCMNCNWVKRFERNEHN